MRGLIAALALSLTTVGVQAAGAEFDLRCANPLSCQRDFRSIGEDINAALHYKALGPAEATGITGVGIGLVGSYVSVDDKAAWRNATGEDVDAIGMVGGVVRKGLPFGMDIGAFYATIPGTGADLYGGELRWAVLEGGVAEPALAVRASGVRSSGIDDFDYEAWGLDVSISKGFAFVTPYAGYGYVWSTLDPHGTFGLQSEDINSSRVFIGTRFSALLLDITPEYEHIDGRNVYNLLFGLSF